MARIRMLAAFLCLLPAEGLARSTLRGLVRDGETGAPLADATVGIRGTALGTETDSTGLFRLTLDTFPARLDIQRAGYRRRELRLAAPTDAALEVALTPAPYAMAETLVQYEDPAHRIMRLVIRAKRTRQPEPRTWSATAYARQTLYSNTAIVAIREQSSRLYWDAEQGRREVIREGRHTANVPDSLQAFAAGAYFVNLYGDEVEVLGQRFVGPTHPEALAHYRFELGATRAAAGDTLYEISVRPAGALETALLGNLVVAQSTWSVVEAHLAPARPLPAPGGLSTDGVGFRFDQHFAPDATGAWRPVDLEYEIEARLGTSALGETVRRWRGFGTPRARLLGVCRLAEHRANRPISGFVYAGDPLEVDALARQDSVARPPEAALSTAEVQAYARLASGRPPLAELPAAGLYALYPGLARPAAPPPAPPDPFATESLVTDEVVAAAVAQGLGLPLPAGPDVDWAPDLEPEVWYNRVEGAHVGGRVRARVRRDLGIVAKGGYDVGLERGFSGAGLALWPEGDQTLTATWQAGARPAYSSDTYSVAGNSFPVLLGIGDYFDYYWSRGWRLQAERRFPQRALRLGVGLNAERHGSLEITTDFDLLCDFQPENGRLYRWACADRDHTFRDNPSIAAGRLRSADLRLEYGGAHVSQGRRPQRRVELQLERAGLGGDFEFTRAQVAVDGHWPTWLSRRAEPAALDLRLVGGWSRGALPPQRAGILEAAIWRYTPFGTFRTRQDRPYAGPRYAALYWEHSFGTAPFEILGLRRAAAAGTGLILHGASGRVWSPAPGCAACGAVSHHEAGLSLVVDGRWRLDVTRRLDRPGWWVGFSRARRPD